MFKRFFRYLRALILGKLDQWEDPETIINAEFRDMKAKQVENRERAIQAITRKSSLQKQIDREEAVLQALKYDATRAREQGDPNLERDINREIARHEVTLIQLRESLRQAEETTEAIKEAIRREEERFRGQVGKFVGRDRMTGLLYLGKNARGVPMYSGTWDPPSSWFCLFLMLVSLVVCGFGFLMVTIWFHFGSQPFYDAHNNPLVALLFLFGGCFGIGYALWLLSERRRLLRLLSIEQLCGQFGLTELTLLQEAGQRGILPRRIINGREFYDLADFGDAAVLLRPASNAETPPDQLLRPTDHKPPDSES